MPLERQNIEKKDFPIGRRGYDPDAVDSHLAELADEVDELKRVSRRRSETLASSASEQVRAIVEAAEHSAAEIQREAEEEARDIRAEASEEAQSTRTQATDQAREYVGKVSESTTVMLQRLDAMESELLALIESLRTGSNRLNADLQLLEGNLEEVRGSVEPRARFEQDLEPGASDHAPIAAAPELDHEPEHAHEPDPEPEPEPEPESEVQPEHEDHDEAATDHHDADETHEAGAVHADAGTFEGEDDTEGARLIALNMALNGTPREETDQYLLENFELHNRARLLDEVYASVEG